MKLLIVGWFYLIYPVISAKEIFEILGYDVLFFPLLHYNLKFNNVETLTNIILTYLKDNEIDVILWWNWECNENVLKNIKHATPSILHCLFNWDHPYCLSNWDKTQNRKILQKNIWDIAFVTSNDKFEEYKQSGSKEVYYLRMFADGKIHYPICDKSYECDVSFVLTNLYEDKERYPEPYFDRKTMIENIIKAGIDIHLYGTENIQKAFPKQYKGPIHFTQNHRVFSNSKINICTHVVGRAHQYCNERVGTILASGGLLFVDQVDGLDTILTNNQDCIFIKPDSYVEQIREILANYDNYKHLKTNAVITAQKKFNLEYWGKFIHQKIAQHKQHVPKQIPVQFIPKKVSIVMTYYNRIEQILNTLQTIEETSYPKNLIEVICYDDRSEIEPLIFDLQKFSYSIRIIYGKLDRDETIINPTYSYNQILRHVTGEYIILQNSECMHIGDIISNTVCELEKNINVLVSQPCFATGNEQITKEMFDNRKDFSTLKNIIKTKYLDLKDYPLEFEGWYNEKYLRPQFLHFCNAFHFNTLEKVGFFDTKFVRLLGFDDNDYMERFVFKHNIDTVIPEHDYKNFVVHQYHGKHDKPRTTDTFLNSYDKYRIHRNTFINENIKKRFKEESKFLYKKYSEISPENEFLNAIDTKWSTSSVFLILDTDEYNINFLRDCLQRCNFTIY